MSAAPFLISLDVGTALIKSCLLQTIDAEQNQRILDTTVQPQMKLDVTLAHLITRYQEMMHKEGGGAFDLVLVGHPTDIDQFGKAATTIRLSHEEALTAAIKRLSSTSTVVAVDIGSHRSMVALGKYGKVSIESFPYGVGEQAWDFLRHHTQPQEVRSWLTQEISEQDIEDYLANKSLYPQIVPLSAREMTIEQAVAKVILRRIAQELPFPWDDIQELVLSGAVLTQPMNLNQSASMILDGLQPIGALHLVADVPLSLFALGGAFEHWSATNYRIGRAMMHATLKPLGTLICVGGPPETKQGLKVSLDTGLSTQQLLEVKPEELVQIPLPDSEMSQLSIASTHKLNVLPKTESQSASGGEVGIIIDGRSRPVVLPSQDGPRLSQLNVWDKQLNLHQQIGRIGQGSV